MDTLKFENRNVKGSVSDDEIKALQAKGADAIEKLEKGTGEGSDFLGWLHLPSSISENSVADIEKTAALLRKDCEYVVAIGIGGSYLGAKAVIEALSDSFAAYKPADGPRVLFAGQNIGEDYTAELVELLKGKKFGIIVISKSGTTTEPAIAFRLLKEMLEAQEGKEYASKHIVAITDEHKGALRKLATEEGYATYVIPDNVGGRFSVLTPVGLLPIAVAGFDIRKLIGGAKAMEAATAKADDSNIALLYAQTRNALYNAGSTDLHSMGQWIQEGERSIFETVISVAKQQREVVIPSDEANLDGLNYIAGKRIDEVNKMAELGTVIAHSDGGVPNIHITLPELSEYCLGEIIYFFEKACGISGYILGVNPFNQPGVEAYKKNMFALLNKPGYEEESKAIQARLK